MPSPFVSRRLYEKVVADCARLRGERDQFAQDRDVQRAAAEKAARQLADSVDGSTVVDGLTAQDAHRVALAKALGAEPSTPWAWLIAEVQQLRDAATEARAEADRLQKQLLDDRNARRSQKEKALERRIQHLEKQLDDATSAGDIGVPAAADWRRRDERGTS